ncbi:MAG: hypothetical protein ACPGO3_04720 [Magnetospiraceae bacterium]
MYVQIGLKDPIRTRRNASHVLLVSVVVAVVFGVGTRLGFEHDLTEAGYFPCEKHSLEYEGDPMGKSLGKTV